jgi:hypothetical protein
MGSSIAWAGSKVFHVTQGSSQLQTIDSGLPTTEVQQHRCVRGPGESPAVEPVRLEVSNLEARHDPDSVA